MIHETPESTAWLAMAPIGAKRIINKRTHRVTQSIGSTGSLEVELDPTRVFDVVIATKTGGHLFEDVVEFKASRMDMNSTDPDNRFGRRVSFVSRDGISETEVVQHVFRFVVLERIELPSEAGSARVLVHDVVAE